MEALAAVIEVLDEKDSEALEEIAGLEKGALEIEVKNWILDTEIEDSEAVTEDLEKEIEASEEEIEDLATVAEDFGEKVENSIHNLFGLP